MDGVLLAPVLGAYLAASFIKGVTGLGFSTICLPLLALFVDPKSGIALVLLPSLASNVLVMVQAGGLGRAVQRFWPVYLAALLGLVPGVVLLSALEGSVSRMFLGAVLMAYALWALGARHVALGERAQRRLAAPVGVLTGAVNGFTGSQIMPLLPYMAALDMDKDDFVTAINCSFTLSSIAMLLLMQSYDLFEARHAWVSLAGLAVVALGTRCGGTVRARLGEGAYKRVVLLLLLAMGAGLMLRG